MRAPAAPPGDRRTRQDQEPDWPDLVARAATGSGVRPVYQPIVDLARGVVAGYEALARFEHGVAATPDVWFAQAARLGRVAQLEAAVVAAALEQRSTLPANTFLTVNVEPESLASPEVMAVFRDHAPLGGVVVEVTEHRELGDANAVAAGLQRLRRLGALIAVDDAGAGYAGLQQILALRPSVLKLDRALVADVDRDEVKSALVEMLGVFANRIDAWVLAEGIETEAEALHCMQLGVPLAQGWFFARPGAPWAPIEPAAAALVARRRENPEQCGLCDLLVVAPSVEHGRAADQAAAFADPAVDVVVAIEGDRPVGIITPDGALAGELRPALTANLRATPAEIAHRLATGGYDERLPVLVTDDAGRYVGTVPVRRLLRRLAG